MKTLYLMRHAKSSWKDPRLPDAERPLNGRGREAARLVGRLIGRKRLSIDLLLSSTAERARQTSALVADAAGLACAVRYDERAYEADAARLLEVVTQIEDSAEAVLLVGHNPGVAELLELLTGEARRVPTAALACVALDVERWAKARAGAGRLEWFTRPKDLAGEPE